MHSAAYIDVRQFASLEPGTVAALAPYLTQYRPENGDLIAIGTANGAPAIVVAMRLHQLDDETCNDVADDLAAPGLDGLWLVGIERDFSVVAKAISRLSEHLASYDLVDTSRFIAVTPDLERWGHPADHPFSTDPEGRPAVNSIDPATGRIAGLAARASAAKHQTTAALFGASDDEVEEHGALQSKFAHLRGMAANQSALETGDLHSLLGCILSPGPITAAEAVNLGLALASNPVVAGTAVERILTAPDSAAVRFDLWCQIARSCSGDAGAVAAALAALAAWRAGKPAAAAAMRIARAADPACALARQVGELIDTGIPAGDLHCAIAARDVRNSAAIPVASVESVAGSDSATDGATDRSGEAAQETGRCEEGRE